MKNPGTILNLWNKVTKKYDERKGAPEIPNKKAVEHKVKIKRGLTDLKRRAAGDLKQPEVRDKFLGLRDRVGVAMKKYCRFVKTAKDDDPKTHARYLKQVTQMTVLVLNLDPDQLDAEDEDGSLDGLDAVETKALDEALKQPDTEPEVSLDDDGPGAVPPSSPPPPPPPPPGTTKEAQEWLQRRKVVEPGMVKAIRDGRGDLAQLQTVYNEAKELAAGRKYGEAVAALGRLEKMLAKAPAANGAGDDAVRFSERLKVLVPAVAGVQKDNAAVGGQLLLKIKEAQTYSRKQDFAHAHALLDGIDAVLKKAAGANGAVRDDGKDVKEATALVKERLAALAASYLEAVKAVPAQQAVLDKLRALAGTTAQTGDVGKTRGVLDNLETAVETVLRTAPKPTGGAPPQPGALDPQTRFRNRLNKLSADFQKALEQTREADPERHAELTALFLQATRQDKAGQHAEGLETLDSLDPLVKGALRATQAKDEIKDAAGANVVKFAQAKLLWQRARQDAAAGVKDYQATVLSDPDTMADPRFPDIQALVARASSALTGFDGRLDSALDAAAGVPAAERPAAVKQCLDLLAEYRAELNKNPLIAAIDDGTYGNPGVGRILGKALDGLAAELAKK